jgi:amino acid transporter
MAVPAEVSEPQSAGSTPPQPSADDELLLSKLGYQQELLRRLNGFSNFAVSFSIICILAGGVTSFSQGLSAAGGASIGLGWPLVALFSLTVAATMGQIASAFPTAGGLYHWAAILGGPGWGWTTAWFNLAGLLTVLAAINVGAVRFILGYLQVDLTDVQQAWCVGLLTIAQSLMNHWGIRWTSRLTDASGYLIIAVSGLLTISLMAAAESWSLQRLITFSNYSGPSGGGIWPQQESLIWLFALGFLLPAYTLTGFDASAHIAEETMNAAAAVPRAIVQAVLISSLFGWVMLCSVVLAMPSVSEAAAQGEQAFAWTMRQVLHGWWANTLFVGIGTAQLLCGLATVTSASRMVYAFARDNGMPGSHWLKHVCPIRRTPVWAIWVVCLITVLLTTAVPYSTIAAACAVLLYISYVIPIALGWAAHGTRWTAMGPWQLGRWYRPCAGVSVLGCVGLLIIGIQPPNQQARWIVGGMAIGLAAAWWLGGVRKQFSGPPVVALQGES